MKIIIYGLGSGLEYIERNLREDNEIVGYSDSYADIGVFNGQPFYKPDKLKDVEYDFLILAQRGVAGLRTADGQQIWFGRKESYPVLLLCECRILGRVSGTCTLSKDRGIDFRNKLCAPWNFARVPEQDIHKFRSSQSGFVWGFDDI